MKIGSRTRVILAVAVVAVIVVAGAAVLLSNVKSPSSEKLQVVTSFYPLYYFSSEVGGDLVEVTMLIPDNSEPHSWEPTASDMVKVAEADVLVYNGQGFEPWISSLLSSIDASKVMLVDTSKNISTQLSDEVKEVYDAAVEVLGAGITATVTASTTVGSAPTVDASGYTSVNFVPTSDGHGGYVKVTSAEGGDLRFFVTNPTGLTISYTNGTEIEYEMDNGLVSSYPMFNGSKFVELEGGVEYVLNFSSSTSTGTGLITVASGEEHEEEGAEEEEHEHEHGLNDPHFWLDPVNAKVQVKNILDAFVEADPANATEYQANAADLTERLDELNQAYIDGLAGRTKNAIVTTHEGFNYLASRYGFEAYAAVGISADEQPSAQDLADLADTIEALGLNYVFSEPIYSDAVMQTIADETGAEVLVLDGVHGRMGVHANMDYFEIMYANLEALKVGLEVAA